MEYKNALTDPQWTPAGDALAGNNSIMTVTNQPGAQARFFRMEIQ
jgi:hypothetical protein